MATNPFGDAAAMASRWADNTRTFLDAQRRAFEAAAGGAADASSPIFGAAANSGADGATLGAAEAAFGRAMTGAEALAASLAASLAGTDTDPGARAILARLLDPRAWLAGGEVAGAAPDIADLQSLERAFTDLAAAWATLRRHQLEHDTLMAEAWTRAAAAFAAEAATVAEGETETSAERLASLWVATAEAALSQTQGGERYLATQRDLLRASTDLRLAQGRVGEIYGRLLGYPTRSEVDDIHLAVSDLRREVRAVARKAEPARPAAKRRPRAP